MQRETREDNTLNLTVRLEGYGELGPQLISALKDASDCTLRSLAPRVPNLEEIFLAATKRSWEETIENSTAKPIAIAKT